MTEMGLIGATFFVVGISLLISRGLDLWKRHRPDDVDEQT